MAKNILKELHMTVHKNGNEGKEDCCNHEIGLTDGRIVAFKRAYLVDDVMHVWPTNSIDYSEKGMCIKNSEIVWVAEGKDQ